VSKCKFDSRPLKVKIALNYVRVGGVSHIIGKALDKGYNFALDVTSIRGMHKMLYASKVAKDPIGNFGILDLGKMTFGCSPCGQSHKILQGGRR
jgi:hypothetical protein